MRPNILCLVSEDCPTWLGPYGDAVARTPHLDALAARGVTFDTANCTSPVCAPSRFSILTGRHPESAPPAQHMTAWGPMPDGIVTYPQMMRAAGYYCTNNSKTHYNVDIGDPATLWDACAGDAHWIHRPADTPFLAVFNCMTTHESCVFETRDGAVTPADVVLPANLPDLPELRQDMASYYNRIEEMDTWMGARLAEVAAAGLTEDTIVIYHSDHASPLPRSKRFCYDDGLRVPLIVHVPERWRHLLPEAPGSRIDTPVSLIDLLQSLAAIAGIDAPAGVQGTPFLGPGRLGRDYALAGRDRMDAGHDPMRTLRDRRFRYIRNYAPHRPWGQHYAYAWQAAGYRAYEAAHLAGTLDAAHDRFWQRKPAEELYDMRADPAALCNLADDPAHAGTLERMRADLDDRMTRIGDGGLIPEGSPVVARKDDPEAYPLARVLDLANAAIRADPAFTLRFLRCLSDPSCVIRYWGAQGLLILAVAGHPLPAGLEFAAEAETEETVLLALWDAIGHAGQVDAAVAALTALAGDAHAAVIRLKAVTALVYLPPRPAISRDAAAAVAGMPDQYLHNAGTLLLHHLDGTYSPDCGIFDHALFRKYMTGHSGIGPQSFPDIADIPQKAPA